MKRSQLGVIKPQNHFNGSFCSQSKSFGLFSSSCALLYGMQHVVAGVTLCHIFIRIVTRVTLVNHVCTSHHLQRTRSSVWNTSESAQRHLLPMKELFSTHLFNYYFAKFIEILPSFPLIYIRKKTFTFIKGNILLPEKIVTDRKKAFENELRHRPTLQVICILKASSLLGIFVT